MRLRWTDSGIFISFRERGSKERMIENLGERRDDSGGVEEMDSQVKGVELTSDRKRNASFSEQCKE